MEITHVIRGEDHISNTPRQILVYKALGFRLPQFAHLSMVMGKDNTRLSKRHGATAVTQYRKEGYLPELVIKNHKNPVMLFIIVNIESTIICVPKHRGAT